MIYVITDDSYELEDDWVTSQIVHINTNKEKAVEYFEHVYGNTKDLPNDKWCYNYNLMEYPDGWDRFNGGERLLKHIDNYEEEKD